MKITFADKKLENLANDDRKMLAALGKIRATILRRRLAQLENATTPEDVRNLPGNYHELKNDRKGQWGCDLDHPYRLVFIPHETPVPSNADWYNPLIRANIPQQHNSLPYSGDEPEHVKKWFYLFDEAHE